MSSFFKFYSKKARKRADALLGPLEDNVVLAVVTEQVGPLLDTHQHEKALEILRTLLETYPLSRLVRRLTFLVLGQLERNAESEAFLSASLVLFPDDQFLLKLYLRTRGPEMHVLERESIEKRLCKQVELLVREEIFTESVAEHFLRNVSRDHIQPED